MTNKPASSRRRPRPGLFLGLAALVFAGPGVARAEDTPTTGASVAVDWTAKTVTLRATCPAEVGDDLRALAADEDGLAEGLSVQGKGRSLVVSGPASALVSALVEGTRSLRVRRGADSDGPTWRIDLPAVELDPQPTSYRYPNFAEGLVLFLPAYGILPGFTVRHASGTGAADRPLSNEAGTLPRVVDVFASPGALPKIRVVLPFPRGADEVASDRFTIVNADGSRSSTIEVRRVGNSVVPPAYARAGARPRPLARRVAVPGVEFRELAEAIQIVRAAGLGPVVFDIDRQTPLDAPALERLKASKALVIRQGIEPEGTLLEGETMLLGVRVPGAEGGDSGVAATTAVDSPLDPGDELGFIPPPGPGPGGAAGPMEGVNPAADRVIDESNLARDTPEAEAGNEPERLAIGRDPGINLNPNMTGDDLRDAALTRLILKAADDGLARDQAAGPVGKAVQAAVAAQEPQLREAIDRGEPVRSIPVEPVLETVTKALGLDLPEADRAAIVAAWREEAARTGISREAIDRNRNGIVADDVTLRLIARMFEKKLYNPAETATIVVDAIGQLLLLDSSSDDGRGPSASLLMLGGDAKAKPTPKPDDSPAARPAAAKAQAPEGPAAVTEASTPDQVRIPDDLIGQSIDLAFRRLTALDLTLDRLDTMFGSDQVVEAVPAPSTWVKPKSSVSLSVRRKTPNLVGQTLGQAKATLGRWKFDARILDDETRPTDVVAEQDPAAGEPLAAGGEVGLRLERVVPNVVRQYSGNGVQALREAGFPALYAQGLSRWDTITTQEPAGGQRARLKAEIRLTFQRTIPDLRQKSFAEVDQVLDDYRLQAIEPDDFGADEELYVADQHPPPGPGPMLAPDDDGQLTPIAFNPGRKLPSFQEQGLEVAKATLERLELNVNDSDGYLEQIPMKVLGQKPGPASIVALGSTVALKVGPVGPLVPDVREIALSEAIRRLEAIGLRASYPQGSFLTDQVQAQDPLPYGPDSPSWLTTGSPVAMEVATKVPNIVGMSVAQAHQLIRSWDLRLAYTGKSFSSDRVVEQDPPAGRYVAHKSDVTVAVKLIVPDIRRQLLARARETLRSWDLETTFEGEAFEDDLVAEQYPAPGTLADHASQVSVRLLVAVPDVRGSTLDQAVEALKQRDLEGAVSNRNALGDDVVRGQSVAPNQYVEHGSTVSLGPIVGPVPDLIGRTIGDAEQLLDRENFRYQYSDDLQVGDVVTAQEPRPGYEAERGRTIALGAQVLIPNLIRRRVEEAAAALDNAPGSLRLDLQIGGRDSDLVIAQAPEPDTWTNPRTVVTVTPGYVVPRLVGRSEDDAVALLRDMGVRAIAGGIRTQETDDPNVVGRSEVASQSQPVDTLVPRNTPIEYQIVQFIEAAIRVPNVIGARSIEDVRNEIEGAGLRFTVLNSPDNGPVVRQMPAPGARAGRGDLVTVFFPPRRPENDDNNNEEGNDDQVVVPLVEGRIVQFAAGQLQQAGLTFELYYQNPRDEIGSYRQYFERTGQVPNFSGLPRATNPSPRIPIDFQFPRPGARVSRGSKVGLIVDQGPPGR